MNIVEAVLAVRGSQLTASERSVFIQVVAYNQLDQEDPRCDASVARLGWDTGLSVSTVGRCLETLVARRCLTAEQRTGQPTIYRVTGLIPTGEAIPPSRRERGVNLSHHDRGNPPHHGGGNLSHHDPPHHDRGSLPSSHGAERGTSVMVRDKKDLSFRDPKKETSFVSHHDRGTPPTREEQQAYQEVATFYATTLREAHGLDAMPPPTPTSHDGRTLAAGLAAGEPLLAAMQYLATGQDSRARFLRSNRTSLAASTLVKKAREYAERGRSGSVVRFANASRGDHPPIAEPDWANMSDEEYEQEIAASRGK